MHAKVRTVCVYMVAFGMRMLITMLYMLCCQQLDCALTVGLALP